METAVAALAAVLAVGPLASGCGGPCQSIARERDALVHRAPTARSAHAVVQVPFALANQMIADILVDPPTIPIAMRRLGPFARFVHDLRAVPRELVIGPGAPGRVRIAFVIDLRDRAGDLVAVTGKADVVPILEPGAIDTQLAIGLPARDLGNIELELGDRGSHRLGDALSRRLPDFVRDRLPAPLAERAAEAVAEELAESTWTVLRKTLLPRLGEVTRVRVRMPELPIAKVDVASLAQPVPALELAITTSLPVRDGIAAAAGTVRADAIDVRMSGSTVAELANWSIARGHAPQRYTRKLKPSPTGQYLPHLDWRARHPRPLVVHVFQIEGGCSHFMVGARPGIEVRGDTVIGTVADRTIERTEGPPLLRLGAWVQSMVQSSVEKSRRAAARTQVTVGGRPVEARLVRASLADDELTVSLQAQVVAPAADRQLQ